MYKRQLVAMEIVKLDDVFDQTSYRLNTPYVCQRFDGQLKSKETFPYNVKPQSKMFIQREDGILTRRNITCYAMQWYCMDVSSSV